VLDHFHVVERDAIPVIHRGLGGYAGPSKRRKGKLAGGAPSRVLHSLRILLCLGFRRARA
jgi:hypothetical protein